MKVMVMVKCDGADEGKITPTPEMMEAMGRYNEQLVAAGVMLDGQGLKPSAEGAQVVFEGGTTSVVDGPFAEAKEIVAGTWLWEVRSLEEAIEWAKRCPTSPDGMRELLEIRPLYSAEDFGEAYTPEQQERDARLAEQIEARHAGA